MLDKSIRREEWEPKEPEDVTKMNRKALRFLRMFFDVEKVGRPGKHDARHRKHEYILKEIKRFSDAPTPKIPPAVFEATLAEYISPAPPSYDSRPLPVTSENLPVLTTPKTF